MIDLIMIRNHCEQIKITCDDYLNLDPICHDPADNYNDLMYIRGQIGSIISILDEVIKYEKGLDEIIKKGTDQMSDLRRTWRVIITTQSGQEIRMPIYSETPITQKEARLQALAGLMIKVIENE